METNIKNKKVVFVIYYSLYKHTERLAREICKGLEKSGVQVRLFQIKETLTDDILTRMKALPKAQDIPFIEPEQMIKTDGFLIGIPTRFGMIPSQITTFFDACTRLYSNGEIANKFVGTFFSAGSIGGGQETTTLSTLPFFAHMGLLYVPLGAKYRHLKNLDIVTGFSAYGAGAVTNDKNHGPNEIDLEAACLQGYDFGCVVNKLISFR